MTTGVVVALVAPTPVTLVVVVVAPAPVTPELVVVVVVVVAVVTPPTPVTLIVAALMYYYSYYIYHKSIIVLSCYWPSIYPHSHNAYPLDLQLSFVKFLNIKSRNLLLHVLRRACYIFGLIAHI